MVEDESDDISIVVSYPISFKESNVINSYEDPDKIKRIIDLFKMAKEDNMTGNELEELKGIIKDVADMYLETSSIDSIIHQCDLDILID